MAYEGLNNNGFFICDDIGINHSVDQSTTVINPVIILELIMPPITNGPSNSIGNILLYFHNTPPYW